MVFPRHANPALFLLMEKLGLPALATLLYPMVFIGFAWRRLRFRGHRETAAVTTIVTTVVTPTTAIASDETRLSG